MLKLILLLLLIHMVNSGNMQYITPLPITECPKESCVTLSTLAANTSDYFHSGSNITVIFLEGSHILDSELVISNIDESLILSTDGSGTAAIICSGGASLEFLDITELQISGLEFIKCNSKVEFVDQFTLENSRFLEGYDSALHLNHTNTSIVRSSFLSNTPGSYQNHIEVLAYVRDLHSNFPWLYPNIQSTSARVGGALLVTSSTVIINSSHFESNTAKVGGAIFGQKGSNIAITNCTFDNNSATGCSDDGCLGGALFVDSSCSVTAHNSIFINNTAGYGGGLIALFQGMFLDTGHNMVNHNRASRHGGAIFACTWSRIIIGNSYYTNNTVQYTGGVIYACINSSITVHNSFFDKNKAGYYGGVLSAYINSSITVVNSSFNNSVAGYGGGVMYANDSRNITVANSSFNNSKADYRGGVVYAAYSSNIIVANSSFNSTVADHLGGVMYAYSSSSVTVGCSRFHNNEADFGGIMFLWKCSSITAGNSSFSNSKAGKSGGVVYAYYSSIITVANSSFENNRASDFGGITFARKSSNITMSNNSFNSSEAGKNGGVTHAVDSSHITAANCSFNNSEAGWNGGIVNIVDSTSITVTNSFINNSLAGYNGGAIKVWHSSNITIVNTFFDRSVARYSGGVMCVYSSRSIIIASDSFDNNVAGDGGVVSAWYSSNILMASNSFNKNLVRSDGGILYARSSRSITMVSNSFNKNLASDDGGVIYVWSTNNITIGNSSFDNNVAGGDGGVIYAKSNCSINVDRSSFHNNLASEYGGVLYTSSKCKITVNNSFLDNNKAHSKGGVMHTISSSSITVGNSSFANNRAGSSGGVISVNTSIVTIDSSSFDDNEACYGGVIFACSSSSITVGNSSFSKNEAHDYGGAMHASYNSSITVCNSSFHNNEARYSDGGVMYANSSSITVSSSSFYNNSAGRDGGVVYGYASTNIVFRNSCTCFGNLATEGGVVYVRNAYFIDLGSEYDGNTASNGGVITLNEGVIEVKGSIFTNNAARNSGGVLYTPLHHNVHVVELETSSFIKNSAISGGTIAVHSNAIVTVLESIFIHNTAVKGGAIYALIGNNLTANYTIFSHNLAKTDGGMIYSERQNRLKVVHCELGFNRADNNGGVFCLLMQSELNIIGDNNFIGNQAYSGGIVYATHSIVNIYSENLLMTNNLAIDKGGAVHIIRTNFTFFSGNNRLVENQAYSGGALYARESRLRVYSESLLMANNTANNIGGAVYLFKANIVFAGGNNTFERNNATTGGAIHINEGQIIFSGENTMLVRNEAYDGGAIYVYEGKIIVQTDSQTKISTNYAICHGGGVYLAKSELMIKGESAYIIRNKAEKQGGGVHASTSSIIVEGAVYFINNMAENGGGVSLEKSARLCGIRLLTGKSYINFRTNRACNYGGALYVDDETNPDMCTAVSIHSTTPSTECFSKSVFINMLNNSAGLSGSDLFGGLLDRCIVHNKSFLEAGIINFQNSSNTNTSELDIVTSHPVRLCFCRDSQPNCDYQPKTIQINRRKPLSFSVELVAHDQIHHPINASIQCSLSSSAGGLGEGQQIQNISKTCTELKYNLFTPNHYERLTFSAVRGPCNNITGLSKRSITVKIICSCPVGFQKTSKTNETCDCICDSVLQSYVKSECNPATESIIRREDFWVSYINHTSSNSSGYVIYPHCPYDYCYTPNNHVIINLNLPNGSDAQCDLNRAGTLCGTCKPGFSVSLGSSKCVPCPTYWPGLLIVIAIVFIISGICLVILLLTLNLTVAVGTLNAMIFYANILAANKNAFFPSGVSFASVFISWLNFDFGFDVCFFDGMDTYIKTWVQLAFPVYIIVLVVVIIQLSYRSSAFGHFIGKKDPVATLATLILLSYAKLLQTIIIAFSSITLVYPDGSKKTLWLPDATVEYSTSKCVVLLVIAIFILLAGLVYTVLLFSWQWLLNCPTQRIKCIRNQKLSSFMETYLIPYTSKHRYWTGLLLLVRVSVYLVSAFNPSGNPRVTLSTTVFIMTTIVIYIAAFGVRMYKNHFINLMETLTYFNITALSIYTWYTIDADTNQIAITNISVVITFIQLTAVIIYHAYRHMNQKLFTMIQGSAIYIKIKEKMPQKKQEGVDNQPAPTNENILLDMVDRPTNTDYQFQPRPSGPTESVIEFPDTQEEPGIPPTEAIKEKVRLETNEQESEQDGVLVIENPSAEINKNEQCISNSKMDQSSQKVLPFSASSDEQASISSQCITASIEIHDC